MENSFLSDNLFVENVNEFGHEWLHGLAHRHPVEVPPPDVKEILVPVDSVSDAEVTQLLDGTRGYGARLTLVHVVEVIPYPPPVSMVDMYRSMVEDGRGLLEDFKHRLEGEGVEVRTKLLIGIPAVSIVEESRDYDLVMMVLPKRPAILERILDAFKAITFSDVRRHVTKWAQCPVVTIRA